MALEYQSTKTDFVAKKRGRKTSSLKAQDQCWADNVTAETNGGFQQVRSRTHRWTTLGDDFTTMTPQLHIGIIPSVSADKKSKMSAAEFSNDELSDKK